MLAVVGVNTNNGYLLLTSYVDNVVEKLDTKNLLSDNFHFTFIRSSKDRTKEKSDCAVSFIYQGIKP
jgi:hypothetical protein